MNIWTNGCFDIIHTGHIDLLWYAKNYNDGLKTHHDIVGFGGHTMNKLFVGLDTDERVKRLKGDKRPINDINTRITIMRSLRMVDEVFIFDTDDELRNLIKELNIDIMVVGDHYRNKEVIGAENAKYGVIFYPTDKRSSTNIIDKIKNL
jgi:D-beta-D-heptose 7-phosphate kinase/D-beta-D-heptose 1-phosphate adenosyltransferase